MRKVLALETAGQYFGDESITLVSKLYVLCVCVCVCVCISKYHSLQQHRRYGSRNKHQLDWSAHALGTVEMFTLSLECLEDLLFYFPTVAEDVKQR